jgi:hypothetical protein
LKPDAHTFIFKQVCAKLMKIAFIFFKINGNIAEVQARLPETPGGAHA